MTVWAVVYGNYSPAEVDSLHFQKENAEARRTDLASSESYPAASMWALEAFEVAGRPTQEQLHEDDPPRCPHGRTIGNGYTCRECVP